MYKYILTSVVALITYNAYGAFDFANYIPTLTELYQTDTTAYIPSAYVLNFSNTQPDSSWIEISYTTNENGIIHNAHYYYKASLNPDRLQELDMPIYYSGTYDSLRGNFVSLPQTAITNANVGIIIGDFFDNHSISGGAIYNGYYHTIGDIIGDFINNGFSSASTTVGDVLGGAIYNRGAIHDINGNFIHNLAQNNAGGGDGAAIYMTNNSTLNSVTGDFINNIAFGDGAAIYNKGAIQSITGNFVNNISSGNGGAIYNTGTIGNITGDFINNVSSGNGGGIYNTGTINNITGIFVNNCSSVNGGTIYNTGSINGNITGVFTDNSSNIIYNTGTISGNIIGNFSGNTANVIYNTGSINISGNVTNNVVTGNLGVISSENGDIYFTSETDDYIISDNYQVYNNASRDLSIYLTDEAEAFFNNDNFTHYIVNDEIGGSNYDLNVIGDDTGYTIFNNNIDNASTVNINSGKMAFGRTPNGYTGTADYGRFSGTFPKMNLTKGTFDIANGYTETITLNNLVSTGNNNTIKIDLDINNAISDVIISQNTIEGQINLAVAALSNLDLGDTIIWFAQAENDLYRVVSANTFVLSDIENLSYDLNIVFDSVENRWGLQKDPNSTYEPDDPNNPDNPDTPDNPDNPDNPDEPENPVPPITLSDDVVQMANYNVHTIRQSVQKMTNSMQKRVGEILWLSSEQQNKQNPIYYNTPSHYKGNNIYGYNRSYYANYNKTGAPELYNAFWTRGVYKNSDIKDTSMGLTGIEFGYDRIISMDNDYKWYLGGIGYASGGTSKFNTTTTDLTGYGLGAYTMLITKSGWFADLVFRQHFITIENETDSYATVGTSYSINHFININNQNTKVDYTASSFNLELGKEFIINSNESMKWFIKPSVEGTYIAISGIDIGDYKVKDFATKMASLSLLIGPRWNYASGGKFQIYGKATYTLDKSDDVDVVINNITTKQSVAVNTTEIGGGLNYRENNNALNLYLEASYITGTDYSEISCNFGLRYNF